MEFSYHHKADKYLHIHHLIRWNSTKLLY